MKPILAVDVSHNNGVLNWTALKNTGHVQFAIIRICHGTTMDRQFAANLAACKSQKIPCAFYWYAESVTVSGAQAEAKFALSKIAGTAPLLWRMTPNAPRFLRSTKTARPMLHGRLAKL